MSSSAIPHSAPTVGLNATIGYIQQALSDKAVADSKNYYKMLETLKETSKQPVMLIPWMQAFSTLVSMLDRRFPDIAEFWLSVDWSKHDDNFVARYEEFICNLVSAHPFNGLGVTKMLVNVMVGGTGRSVERAHAMLQRILSLIPTGPTLMVPVLTEAFPHYRESQHVHVTFVNNLLRIIDYAPILKSQILALIVDRIIQIDVQIQEEVDDMDQDELEDIQAHVLVPTDPDEHVAIVSSTMGSSVQNNRFDRYIQQNHLKNRAGFPTNQEDEKVEMESDDELDDAPMASIDFRDMVYKLDGLLMIMFEYLSRHRSVASPTTPITPNTPQDLAFSQAIHEEQTDLFNIFLNIFERTILRTHKSRYTQFLLFYLCSFDPDYSDQLLGMLVSKVFDTSSPAMLRMAAASYVGSYVARAKYLDLSRIKTCLSILSDWTNSYIDTHDSGASAVPDPRRHGVFYSVVQSMFYIFVFRWRILIDEEPDLMGGPFATEFSAFPKIVNSRFRPLRVCSQSVVREFARITHKLELLYCYPAMQQGRRVIESTGDGPSFQELEMVFPFDPYRLRRSSRFIAPLYCNWEEDEGEIEEMDTRKVRPDKYGVSMGTSSSEDSLLEEVLGMSLT